MDLASDAKWRLFGPLVALASDSDNHLVLQPVGFGLLDVAGFAK